MSTDYKDFKASVLSDCQTEGLGVYEVWWGANSHYPSLPVSARLQIAERVVKDLLEAGAIRLVRGRWIGPEHERQPISDGLANPWKRRRGSRKRTTWSGSNPSAGTELHRALPPFSGRSEQA